MNRTLKLSLFCAGIFACGVVVGGLGARRVALHAPVVLPVAPPQSPPDGFGPQQLRRFSSELALTEAQKVALAPILDKTGEELRDLRRESFRQTSAVIEAMEVSVAQLLTPAQREKLTVLQADQRNRMKARMEERQRRKNENGERREGDGERRNDSRPAPEGGPPPNRPPGAAPPAAPAT